MSVGADDVAPLSKVQPVKMFVSRSMSPHHSVLPSEPRTTMQSSLVITVAAGPSTVAPVDRSNSVIAQKQNEYFDCLTHLKKGLEMAKESEDEHQVHAKLIYW